MSEISLPGDSGNYELLSRGVELSKYAPGLTCEIGLRLGGGTKHIIDALAEHAPHKTHIAIDPYGHIPYEHKENHIIKLDYTNEMRDECLANLYKYTRQKNISFIFFNLEDLEYFMRYSDGVPVYNIDKEMINQYSFVHFDGPHAVTPLLTETNFFYERIAPGACWAFDDVIGYYNHDIIENWLFNRGFKLIEKLRHKALYQYAP